METLNHIIVYNFMFSSVRSCCICSPCCRTNNVQMVVLHLSFNFIYNKFFFYCALNCANTQKPPNYTLTPLKKKVMVLNYHRFLTPP